MSQPWCAGSRSCCGGVRTFRNLILIGGTAGGLNLDIAAISDEPQVAGRVTQTGYVSQGRLCALYAGASAFCYLSEYEGFGLPPLEAMAAGVPTVVSDRASLPEVTAGAALRVDPHDRAAVAEALERLVVDDELRRSLARRGPEVARRFSWRDSAERLAALYARVMERAARNWRAADEPATLAEVEGQDQLASDGGMVDSVPRADLALSVGRRMAF